MSEQFDDRGEKVRFLAVVEKIMEVLQPQSMLICGRKSEDFVKKLAEKMEYKHVEIFACNSVMEKYEDLPVDTVELFVSIDFFENVQEDEFLKILERISKISKKAVFVLQNTEKDDDDGGFERCRESLKRYFPTLTMLPAVSNRSTIFLTFDLPQEIENQCKSLLQGNINYIDSLEQLVNLLRSNEGVFLLPGMRGGRVVLDWLDCSGNLEYVSCFLTDTTKFTNNSIDAIFEKNLPLLRLHCMLHFREDGIFIVAINPIFHGGLYKRMAEAGFKNIFFLSSSAYNQIAEELKKIMDSNEFMWRFMAHVTEKMNKLELLIEEKPDICAVNSVAFEKYRNRFQGKKVVVIAGGPTVKYYKPIADAIHIGVNRAWLAENISFDFLFTNDVRGIHEKIYPSMERSFEKIKERVFIGIRPQHVKDGVFFDFPIDVSLKNKNVSRFYLEDVHPYCNQQICQNICHNSLAHFSSTVFNAIHFALFTCPAELYLVGCDVSHSGHFYGNSSNAKQDIKMTKTINIVRTKVGYARMKDFAGHYYPGTKIISVNPVNLKGLFTDIYTDEYKKSLENE